WYNIIPIIIILVCGAVIFYIIRKKFPAVSNLDLANLPQEKEKRVKQQIIASRLKRNVTHWLVWLKRISQPVWEKLAEWFKNLYRRLLEARENLKHNQPADEDNVPEIGHLFATAEEMRKKEKYNEAEKLYIKVISLDSKNIVAFKMLGQLYLEMGKLTEAKETLRHVLKLTEEDAEVYEKLAELAQKNSELDEAQKYYSQSLQLNNANSQNYFNLAEVHEELNNPKEAFKCMKEALKLSPKNPKYLDAIFNLSILIKDKAEALDAYKALKEINPENGKLGEMKKQMDEL
ncbi:MAG: tetratricopeptide repeat protein, partial [Patescibacteria group bacterium]